MKVLFLSLSFLCTISFGFAQSEANRHDDSNNTTKNKNTMKIDMKDSNPDFNKTDAKFFKHCLSLAEKALKAGDQPFGSIIVNGDNEVVAEARNRVNEKNVLAHPEIELAEWALENMSLAERQKATMYTTGEHCPMCASAHGWAQIGGLYYLSSAKQLGKWLDEFDADPSPIEFIPAEKLVKNAEVKGPAEGEMLDKIKQMHQRFYANR